MMKFFISVILSGLMFLSVLGQEPDSTGPPLHIWSYDNFQQGITKVTPDTLLDRFYDFMPYRSDWVNSSGNNGSATFPLCFAAPDENIPFFFKPWSIYYSPDRNRFYNTHKPYTNIKFAAGSSKDKGEQAISMLHTQNITPKLNVSIKASAHNAIGSYLRQENRLSCFRFSTNYLGEKYKLFAFYEFEKFKLNENGGIQNDEYITDSLYKPDNLNVNLMYAKNLSVFRNGYFHQIISLIGKTDSIDSLHSKYKSFLELHHGGRYQWFKKIYDDKPSSFYNDIYIDSLTTHDSLQSERITQDLSLVLTDNNSLKIGILAGALYDQENFYYFSYDTLFNSFGWQVSLYKTNSEKYKASLTYESWVSGYLQNNSRISGNLNYSLLLKNDTILIGLDGFFKKKNAEFYENNLKINNFNWNHDFSQAQYSKASFFINDKKHKSQLRITINTAKNFIFYDQVGLPMQREHTIQIVSAEVMKNFTFRNIHFNNRALFQQSSNDRIIPLPSFVGVHSLYYQFLVFKKVLKVQTGVEVYFFTKYFAPKFIPSTGQYALQHERKTGDYPFTDVFINLNLKRACLFFKLEHANYTLSPENYFYAPHYPVAPRAFKFGVSWNFYD